MAREKPYCQSVRTWLIHRLNDKFACAPLTGQDQRALHAFVHLVELYGASDTTGRHAALSAMGAVLQTMQPLTRHLAKAAIPHVLDWSHEDQIWARIATAPSSQSE